MSTSVIYNSDLFLYLLRDSNILLVGFNIFLWVVGDTGPAVVCVSEGDFTLLAALKLNPISMMNSMDSIDLD
jgi:hypothetical protein